MSALLESLAAGAPGPDAEAALRAIVREGLPGPRVEAWKYTSLRALERREFGPATPVEVDATAIAGIPTPRIVFVNGRHDANLSDLAGLASGLDVSVGAFADAPIETTGDLFARINAAHNPPGLAVTATGTDGVLHLACIGASNGTDVAWNLHHRVTVAPGASLVLVEHQRSSGANTHLANSVTDIEVGERGTLLHARVQDDATGATAFLQTRLAVGARARATRVDIECGGALSRHLLDITLAGEGARVDAHGVLLGTGRRHLDTRLGVVHAAADTTCDLHWRALAADRSRVAFHGGITIQPGADGSDAALSSRNLLLSDAAEIDAQPVLEIHADEVKAAHGATVGQLDPNALFYLRSRGLPEADARRMLTRAFCRDLLGKVGDAPVRDWLEARLDAALDRLDTP